MLQDPKCRFDYPLAPVRLHHAGLVSLECPSRRTSRVDAHPLAPEHHGVRFTTDQHVEFSTAAVRYPWVP
ncbi:unnamed protein product [Prunus armeniaca]